MTEMLIVAVAVAVAAAVVYLVGWREERRTEARVQRRLAELRVQRRLRELRQINRDPGQGAGA